MEACWLNVKYTMNTRSLREDTPLEPGDLIFVPQNSMAEIGRFRPTVWFLRETASRAEGGGLCPRN